MTADEIIVALGDTAKVAARFDLRLPAVSNWKERGLPRSRLMDIHEFAVEQRLGTMITPEVIRAAVASPVRRGVEAEAA